MDPLVPDDAQEQGARGGHDGDVWHHPVSVVALQDIGDADEEGVFGGGGHDVVGDACWVGFAGPGGVCEERVEFSLAALRGYISDGFLSDGGYLCRSEEKETYDV